MKKGSLRRLTMAALCGAVAFVLMFFSFSVPVLSPFAEFDFSALPELIGGFILGPIGAVEIIVVKIGLKLLFKGSSSLLTGELMNLILSLRRCSTIAATAPKRAPSSALHWVPPSA